MTDEKRQEYIDVLQKCLKGKWKNPKPLQYMLVSCEACEAYSFCEDCPICIATGYVQCRHTPVHEHYASSSGKRGWPKMIKNERLFLRAIIDHLKAGHELVDFRKLTAYDWRKDA